MVEGPFPKRVRRHQSLLVLLLLVGLLDLPQGIEENLVDGRAFPSTRWREDQGEQIDWLLPRATNVDHSVAHHMADFRDERHQQHVFLNGVRPADFL